MPEKIPLEPVTSSLFSAAGYDAAHRHFDIAFKSGPVWRYSDVPPDVVLEFLTAPSKGQFYSKHLKGKFTGHKMTGTCPVCRDQGWIGDRCADCDTGVYRRED